LEQRVLPPTTHATRIAGPIASSSTTGLWLGAAIAGAAIASTTYGMWLRTRAHPRRVDVIPWLQTNGGGVTISGRL